MKKLKILISLILVFSLTASLSVFAAKDKEKDESGPPEILAKAAILIDFKTGYVLYEKNPEKKMEPASTTKVMTYLVVADAIENGELDLKDELVYTRDMQGAMDPDGSNIGLKVDEKMSVSQLLRGMLISSGNDAAILLSCSVAGSEEEFVERMNQKAKEIGLEKTHFTNVHGLADKNHYTTAKDLAEIAKCAMKDDLFREIVGSNTYEREATNKTAESVTMTNTNNLLSPTSAMYYKYATGIKTGYTNTAGFCLVSSAKKDSRELICVVLNDDDSRKDSKALLEYGFNNFKEIKVAKKGDLLGEVAVKQGADSIDHVRAVAMEDIYVTVPNDADTKDVKAKITYKSEELYAPVKKSAALGEVEYSYKGTVLGKVSLVAESGVERHTFGFLMSLWETIWGSVVVRVICYIILIGAFLFVLLVVYGFYLSLKKSKARKRRKSKYRPPMY